MLNPLFPEPDTLVEPHALPETEGQVIQALISGTHREVVLLVIGKVEDALTGFRFTMPMHARVPRRLFRSAGARDIPRETGSYQIDSGTFPIRFQGTVVGEDTVPVPEDPEAKRELTRIMVLQDVSAYEAR